MDNPYMTAAFMGQMQTGLQNASQNFTRAYEGAADRRQSAYLEGERNRIQMERDEKQRQFQNEQQAKGWVHEDIRQEAGWKRDDKVRANTQEYQGKRDKSLHDMSLEELKEKHRLELILHAQVRGETLEDRDASMGLLNPEPEQRASAYSRKWDAEIGAIEGNTRRADAQAEWMKTRDANADDQSRDRLAEATLKDLQATPAERAGAQAHINRRLGITPPLSTLQSLWQGGTQPAPAPARPGGQVPSPSPTPPRPEPGPAPHAVPAQATAPQASKGRPYVNQGGGRMPQAPVQDAPPRPKYQGRAYVQPAGPKPPPTAPPVKPKITKPQYVRGVGMVYPETE